ncbi:hypothetical protein [Thermosporothrix hazakensis]|nr:hypothetical protein [Thermosporothrix hazakensis]
MVLLLIQTGQFPLHYTVAASNQPNDITPLHLNWLIRTACLAGCI